MRRRLFRFKLVADRSERSLGVLFRAFGVDFAFLLMGFLNDWRLISLEIPNGWGAHCQFLGFFVGVCIGDESLYERERHD